MSEKILKIVPPATGEPNQNCIAVLEDVLERARSGETIGVVIAEQGSDNGGSWSWGGFCGSFSMLGAMQIAQAALMADQIEDC